jgi:hypothetical protein
MKPTEVIETVIGMAEYDSKDFLRRQLYDYLCSQPPAIIYGVVSVMYMGRGDFDNERDFLGVYSSMSDTFPSPPLAVNQMVQKTPLAQYLRDGMVIARKWGIDLDKILGT